MAEVAWFTEVPPATLAWTTPDLGYLHFYDPNGERAAVPVTPDDSNAETARRGFNVWHIDIAGDVATVSPSVHFVDRWHSPNPVQFRIVDRLEEPA